MSAAADDAELVARLRAGDEAAFAQLVREYQGRLTRFAQNFVGDRAVAEEVVQESWMGVLKGLKGFEGRSTLKSWIFRIVSNRAKTKAEREKRSLPFSSVGPDDGDGPALDPARFDGGGHWVQPPSALQTQTPEGAALDAEVRRVVEAAVEALPAKERLVVTMRDLEGLTSQEACEVLEVTAVHQRVLLHRGRTRVRAAIERELGKR